MKIIVLGNQAKAMSNFWSVLIRHMRRAGHEVICCAPAGDADAEAALAAQGASLRHYALDRKGLNPLSDLRTPRRRWPHRERACATTRWTARGSTL